MAAFTLVYKPTPTWSHNVGLGGGYDDVVALLCTCCTRIHVSSMVSSENLVLDSLAKPSRYNHAFNGTYYTHTHTHTGYTSPLY